MPIIGVFVVLPIADAWLGDDFTEPAVEGHRAVFDWSPRLWFPTQTAALAFVAVQIATGAYSPLEIVGITVSTGILIGSSGITIAHELMHRRARLDRALAEMLMLTSLYTWFCIEHVQGHHKTVSTPMDPTFAPLGRSLYSYLPGTLFGGLRSAWAIETRRVRTRAVSGLSDRRLRYALSITVLITAVASLGGPLVLAWFVGQAAVGIVLLETINYIQHYGLHRRQNDNGKYERLTPEHSWNTPSRLTNYFLFNLQRHADHHAFAARPYDQLRNLPDGPTLPAGYATMVLMALVPPLWFRAVHPLIHERPRSAPNDDTLGAK